MSWQWQWLWWRHQGTHSGAELVLLAAYSDSGELLGLAPLTLRSVKLRGGFSSRRLETLGSFWRQKVEVFSEYLDFIVDRRYLDEVLRALENALAEDRRWDELVIAYTRRNGIAQRLETTLGSRCHVRLSDSMEAHTTAIPPVFDDYLKALDAGTRRKLWNHRKKLDRPELAFARPEDVGEYLDLIDRFLNARWGGHLFAGRSRSFHLEFAAAMAEDESLRLSRLSIEGRPISVMYNFRRGGKEYNLQAGFDLNNNAGISPGYLHFGYSLERACSDGVGEFDFLAGKGRSRQYKQDFRTRSEQVICLQFIRSRWLRAIFHSYDWWQKLRAPSKKSGDLTEGQHAHG